MQKIYSLLRNNKQTGPYTLEELLDLGLKPFDLIWMEGKSGGWSYPSEIEALKPFVTEVQPAQKTNKLLSLTNSVTSAAVNTEVKKEGANTTAKHIYISFPAGNSIGKTTVTNAITNNFPEPVLEEESPEAKLERKAQELRNKIQAFAEGKKEPKADNELDTKYTRSLEDIKEEYSDWLHHQKTKKAIPYKKILTGVVAIGFVLFTGYFIADKLLTPKSPVNDDLAVQRTETVSPVSATVNEKKVSANTKKKTTKKRQLSKAANSGSTKHIASTNRIDDYIDSLQRVERKSTEGSNDYEKNEEAVEMRKENPVVNNSSKQNSAKTVSSKESAAAFAQLVQLSESTGSEGSKLTIYNNSDRFLNFVAVDVYYYRPNDKLLQRKTLYFHNISPKSSSPLYVPELKRASSIKYQMGLISTEGGLYYAKQ